MSIRDESRSFWQCYGVRARIRADSLGATIERLRAIAGTIRVNHPITLVSPSRDAWRIESGLDIEERNARRLD